MYKKISFYIQMALILVLAKQTLQAQDFNFVYIDTCYTEPYNRGFGTMLNWKSLENHLIEYYNIERSTDFINWKKAGSIPKNKIQNTTDKRILYRWFDNLASQQDSTIIWYRLKAYSSIGEYVYDMPPIPHKAINYSSASPFVFDNKAVKFSFFNDSFEKGSSVSLINIITNQTYTFPDPLKKGMQTVHIPAHWNLSKGSYILQLNYEVHGGIISNYHQVLIL